MNKKNNVYTTRTRLNEIDIFIFSRFNNKWPRKDPEMTQK